MPNTYYMNTFLIWCHEPSEQLIRIASLHVLQPLQDNLHLRRPFWVVLVLHELAELADDILEVLPKPTTRANI
jgi:hypothetical protein